MGEVGEDYTCAQCGGTFERIRNDDNAYDEAAEVFGGKPRYEDLAIVCDGCFRNMSNWWASLTDAQREALQRLARLRA